MSAPTTRDALLTHGALLFARHGVEGVTPKQLHDAIGARNESAVHYHFGGRAGLVSAIVQGHLDAVEQRRARLIEQMAEAGTTEDLRSVLHALAAPMADDLATPVGRAHLRMVAELSHPAFAYRPAFAIREAADSRAGTTVVRWLERALPDLPPRIRTERLAALRGQLISSFGLRAQLLDDDPDLCDDARTQLFVENLLDMLLAGLTAPPSREALDALAAVRPRRTRSRRAR
jgi:AcrR family transcriptional regulator